MTWLLFAVLVFDWWNSSVAAGGALLTAHELKGFFSELLGALQKENALLRTELGVLTENERRTRDELKAEVAAIRKEILAILLHNSRALLEGGEGEGGTETPSADSS